MSDFAIASFDLDDTCIATKDASVKNVRFVLGKLDWCEIPSVETLVELYGKQAANGLDAWHSWVLAACPGLDKERVLEFGMFYRTLENELPEKYPIIDGTKECIDYLAREGLSIALATGRAKSLLDKRLTEAGIPRELFDVVYAKEDCPEHKPDPRYFLPFLEWASQRDVRPGLCFYVGDHVYDGMAALGAGMEFIAVLTGGTTKEEFVASGVKSKNIVESVKYVPERLKGGL